MTKKYFAFVLFAAALYLICGSCDKNIRKFREPAVEPIIDGTWAYHKTPEAVGWDSGKLKEAKSHFDTLSSAAAILVCRNKVLTAWGSYTSKYYTHSARKSFMSALYGIFVNDSLINLQNTVAELNIDDNPPLTEQEKTARVVHLLMARSGIYHTAVT